MSTKRTWGLTFFISLGILLALYAILDFQFVRFEVNEQNQLVMYDGFSGPMTHVADVSDKQESLSVLDKHVKAFNTWILFGLGLAAFFIASYWVLASDALKENQIKKKYLRWTFGLNAIAAAAAIFIWVRYFHLVNDAYNNVFF
ncbi:hypothetical protein D3H55_05075 [Bacillus salacetis]|uniref:Uncharacterized protein n=1 Tax=Bacillus salacetis TaxID=2315464 RepID=A0A3A1R4B0_9BACI|nr:hypothetical protein [Bacillus salacetis]RIW37409.1 hypothetical protein D3H55_05075 [Bacillus salacetis]